MTGELKSEIDTACVQVRSKSLDKIADPLANFHFLKRDEKRGLLRSIIPRVIIRDGSLQVFDLATTPHLTRTERVLSCHPESCQTLQNPAKSANVSGSFQEAPA